MDPEVIRAIAAAGSDVPMVLVTITRTWGSSPRKAGSQMLVFADGRTMGTIGGGCGEAEVRIRALQALARKQMEVYRLDMTTGTTAEEEGMVCGGVMEILLEPL